MRFHTVTIGPCTLILGDCLEVLPTLPWWADCIVTDPPYRLTSGGKGEKGDGSMSGIFSPDDYDNSGDLMESMRWSQMGPPFFRACKPNADAYVMANDKNFSLMLGAMHGAGWKLHNFLAWDKGAPTPNRWYMKNLEFTAYLWRGESKTINHPGSKQLFKCPRPKDRQHPTQKPVELMQHYITNSTQPDELVLDPFMGSGSTLVAACLSGRRAVGIEIDPEWFDLACERVEAALECHQSASFDRRSP